MHQNPLKLHCSLWTLPFEMFRREFAVPDRVLKALMPHEGGARSQVSASRQIEPAGMAEHVRMNFERGEFRRQL